MKMFSIHNRACALLLTVMAVLAFTQLTACSVFEPAQSTEQKLAYAYGTHTAVVNATTQALNDKTISSSDAQHVLNVATDSRTILDGVKTALAAGDTKTAEGQLAMATSILAQLQSYLSTRK